MIKFKANGREFEKEGPQSLLQFIEELKLHAPSVIVEYNGEFLPRENYDETTIENGDNLEIIRAMSGG